MNVKVNVVDEISNIDVAIEFKNTSAEQMISLSKFLIRTLENVQN